MRLSRIYDEFKDRVSFLTIYIKEAHPDDGWQLKENCDSGVCYTQPKSLEERLKVASDFINKSGYRIPLVVDGIDDEANKLYSAWPERLYIIRDGKIAYKGGMGPFGFNSTEVLDWLKINVK